MGSVSVDLENLRAEVIVIGIRRIFFVVNITLHTIHCRILLFVDTLTVKSFNVPLCCDENQVEAAFFRAMDVFVHTVNQLANKIAENVRQFNF